MKQIKNNKNVLFYPLTICLIFGITYLPLLLKQNMYMYIDIGADTYCSYWPSFSYVRNLLNDISAWDMSLGLGAPTITQICYFLVDPFNWIILLFSARWMYIGIFISLILKYIALAVAAYFYVLKMKISENDIICTIMAAGIVFSGWFVGWGQHYNYATMYVFFVILLFYFEKWLQNRKWVGFVSVLAYLCIMTPYYSYMVLLFLAIYYLCRYFCINGKCSLKLFILDGLKTCGLCFLGIGCSGILFLPAMEEILNSPRVGGQYTPGLNFSSAKELGSFVLRLFSNNILGINDLFTGYGNYYEAPFMYVGILGILLIPVLFHKTNRKNIYCCVGTICLAAVIFAPNAALIFNALSAITYRWTFVFVPIAALGIGLALERLKDNRHMEYKSITIVFLIAVFILVGYAYYLFKKGLLSESSGQTVFISTIFCLLILILYYVFLLQNARKQYMAIYILFVIELSFNAYYSVNCRSLIPISEIANLDYFDETSDIIDYLRKTDLEFYRVSKKYAFNDLNDSMIQHYNGEKYYCSTLSPSYWNIQDIFDLRGQNSNYFRGFDDKQVLRNITCGKYIISSTTKNLYGHNLIADFGNRFLYINENALDFGFLYDHYVDMSDFVELPSYKKADIVYEACIIDDVPAICDLTKVSDTDLFEISNMEFSLDFYSDSIEVTLAKPNDNPILLEIIASDTSNMVSGSLYKVVSRAQVDTNDYLSIQLARNTTQYYLIDELDIEKLLIRTLPENISEIHLYEKNMFPIEKQLAIMKQNTLQLDEFSNSYIHGKIKAENGPKILFVPIIYDKNWHVYINNTEQETFIVNGGFIGVIVPDGESDIVLQYRAKSYGYGRAMTICSILIMLIIWIKDYIFVKKRMGILFDSLKCPCRERKNT